MFTTPGSRSGHKVAPRLYRGHYAESVPIGVVASGVLTPRPALGNIQHYVNGGAHTIAPPTVHCSMVIDMLNNASAGAVTTSGFTKVTGDSLTTTDTNKFRFFITVGAQGSHLHKQALQ